MKILEDSGIGMPPYQNGAYYSGCYFCFYQKPIEWVRLLEKHPEKFDQAQAFEKASDELANPSVGFMACRCLNHVSQKMYLVSKNAMLNGKKCSRKSGAIN